MHLSNQSDLIDILSQHADIVAPRLLGSQLVYEKDGQKMVGRIVETEAYGQSDPASHSFNGRTPRSDVMFGPPGHLYVYFTYGMYYCCNVVTGPEGYASAVLIRAIEPLEGEEYMRQNRAASKKHMVRNSRSAKLGQKELKPHEITNGPAKLCQAYGIDKAFNGHDLTNQPLLLQLRDELNVSDIVTTTRIGISQAKDVPWRFYIKNNPYVSKL